MEEIILNAARSYLILSLVFLFLIVLATKWAKKNMPDKFQILKENPSLAITSALEVCFLWPVETIKILWMMRQQKRGPYTIAQVPKGHYWLVTNINGRELKKPHKVKSGQKLYFNDFKETDFVDSDF